MKRDRDLERRIEVLEMFAGFDRDVECALYSSVARRRAKNNDITRLQAWLATRTPEQLAERRRERKRKDYARMIADHDRAEVRRAKNRESMRRLREKCDRARRHR